MSASRRLSLPLMAIAHARSGDKGNHANLAILAYTDEGFAWLCHILTEAQIGRYFASLKPRQVRRYLAANVRGLNFVLYDCLAGGASRSLRTDTQGKTLAQLVLPMPIEVPESYAAMLAPGSVFQAVPLHLAIPPETAHE